MPMKHAQFYPWSLIALLLASASCSGSAPQDRAATSEQPLDATVIGALASVTSAIFDTAETEADQLVTMSELESQINMLAQSVADLTYKEKRDAVLELNRTVAILRGDITSALFNIGETPSMSSGPETVVLAAAEALTSDSYYYFPGPPDRFDPRAAVSTFIEAVDGWLTVRATAGLPMTDAARSKLRSYASTLLTVSQRTLAAVSCYRRHHTVVESGGGSRTSTCVTDVLCDDSISLQTWIAADLGERSGTCSFSSIRDATYSANAAATYGPEEMAQIAAAWQLF